MARPFTTSDVQRLIEVHNRIRFDLNKVEQLELFYKNEIKDAVNAYLGKEVLKQLKDVPIEEINRDKKGFRTKLLREYGYCTLADIAGASVASISSIRGIGTDTAYSIYREVRQIVDQTAKSTKIRLSLDDKNADSSRLVIAISKLHQSQTFIDSSRRLKSIYSSQIDHAMEDLKPAKAGRLVWWFTSAVRKQTDGFHGV